MIIDHRHDDQRNDDEKTDVVDDADAKDDDDVEWVERIQQPEGHDASIPIVNHIQHCIAIQGTKLHWFL